ncbi:GGDEF domain-containing protein [Vibrio makurazakiensis]|uniref:GGDEF domain-containing protein n=1 Tax=Vibrio makurazakiensis TaxID=2910250 RepID=UPI003D1199BA
MADIRATRRHKVVCLCSLTACGLFIFYAVSYALANEILLTTFSSTFAAITLGIYIYIKVGRKPTGTDLMLSALLLTQGVILFLYSGAIPNAVLWLYPLLATVIFINEFKIGLILSSAFCLLLSTILLSTSIPLLHSIESPSNFLLSLLGMAVVCHASSYYYSKVLSYIQSLYQEGIEDLAYMDQLTGLANRWSFEHWAAKKLDSVTSDTHITALVFLDIDNFKSINDNYGHDVGDRVLQHFAKRLKNNIRTKDRKTQKHDYSVARFAGDEFVLMLYDVRSQSDLDNILERICKLFDNDYQNQERINELTLSVGVALYPQDATELPELTRCADKAMYQAKHSGKNRYAYYHDSPAQVPIKQFSSLTESLSEYSNVTQISKNR